MGLWRVFILLLYYLLAVVALFVNYSPHYL